MNAGKSSRVSASNSFGVRLIGIALMCFLQNDAPQARHQALCDLLIRFCKFRGAGRGLSFPLLRLLGKFKAELCASRITRGALVGNLLCGCLELGDPAPLAALGDGDFLIEGASDRGSHRLWLAG